MESQKISNLLGEENNFKKGFQTRKWYIINDQSDSQYNEDFTIIINTEVIKENICDFGDAYILVSGNVKIEGADANTKFCLKGASLFTTSALHLNDAHIETAEILNLAIKHYNLMEYSDNFQDTIASLYQFKREEQPLDDNISLDVVTEVNS